ncbi:hypothetical protein BESB_053740 [Besnoitia besnoiti]|uniref:HhH-GPD domain-containing protein n=1 Tax=Besnoitia besnoiti TaxID=94643 RepID=A0A2A9MJ93_BESBE|nr:hypothetical protein BESB_053740 [Besnoitia besnoiti]PFH35723.1 hypothetical protein BESB_053740 [Besnoitia besnoiti]
MGPTLVPVSLSPLLVTPRASRLARPPGGEGSDCQKEDYGAGQGSPAASLSAGFSPASQRRQLLSTFTAVFPPECTPRNTAPYGSSARALKRSTSAPLLLEAASCLAASPSHFRDPRATPSIRRAGRCRPSRLESASTVHATPPLSPVSAGTPGSTPVSPSTIAAAAEATAPHAERGSAGAAGVAEGLFDRAPHASGTETPRGPKEEGLLSPLLSPAAPKAKRRRLVLAETQSRDSSSSSPLHGESEASGAATPLQTPSRRPGFAGLQPDFFLHLHQWRYLPVSPAPAVRGRCAAGARSDTECFGLPGRELACAGGARDQCLGVSEPVWRQPRGGREYAGRLDSRHASAEGSRALEGAADAKADAGASRRAAEERHAGLRGERSCLSRRRVRDEEKDVVADAAEKKPRQRGSADDARPKPEDSQSSGRHQGPAERQVEVDASGKAKVTLLLSVPSWYSLAKAVCSYGFFCMEPNKWTPAASLVSEAAAACADAAKQVPKRGRREISSSVALEVARDTVGFEASQASRLVSAASAGSPGEAQAFGESCVRSVQSHGRLTAAPASSHFENGDAAGPGEAPRVSPRASRGRRRRASAKSAAVEKGESGRCSEGGVMSGEQTKAAADRFFLPGTFSRPLRFGPFMEKCCHVTFAMKDVGVLRLEILADAPLAPEEEDEILSQVRRMCRLSETDWRHAQAFWRLHPEAAERGFGLLFRSPTLWEDIVKTVTICNVRWRQSCVMNDLFCRRISSIPGSFPSPLDFLRFNAQDLSRLAGVGYRADRLLRLAHRVVDGSLDLAELDEGPPPPPTDSQGCDGVLGSSVSLSRLAAPACAASLPSNGVARGAQGGGGRRKKREESEPSEDTSYQDERKWRLLSTQEKLLAIHGIGPFAAHNILQLIGFTEVDAFDSETIRHMEEVHGVKKKSVKDVHEVARQRFAPYMPYQFVAYWYELWKHYEQKVGARSEVWTEQNSVFILQDERHMKPPCVTADGSLPAYASAAENAPANLLRQIRELGGLPFMAKPPPRVSASPKAEAEAVEDEPTAREANRDCGSAGAKPRLNPKREATGKAGRARGAKTSEARQLGKSLSQALRVRGRPNLEKSENDERSADGKSRSRRSLRLIAAKS